MRFFSSALHYSGLAVAVVVVVAIMSLVAEPVEASDGCPNVEPYCIPHYHEIGRSGGYCGGLLFLTRYCIPWATSLRDEGGELLRASLYWLFG